MFAHQAVAVDTHHNHLYMTEDKHDGCLLALHFLRMANACILALNGEQAVARVEA